MRKFGIGSRVLSAVLALIMVLSMVPALQLGAEGEFYPGYQAAVDAAGHGMGLTSADKITMPIKIMDFEADGMFFDYLFGLVEATGGGNSTLLDEPKEYVPETNFWVDFTGTLSGSRANPTKVTTPTGGTMYYGKGLQGITRPLQGNGDNSHAGELWMNSSLASLGGKQHLHIKSLKTNGVPLTWNVAKFTTAQAVENVRYVTVVYLDYTRDASSGPARMGISCALDTTGTTRYAKGNFSNWFYLPTDTIGKWEVDYAVIDLHDGGSGDGMPLDKTITDLYLDFPMDATGKGNQNFKLFALGCFETAGDAEQFGVWGASVGSLNGNTDSGQYMRADGNLYTLPKDLSTNQNRAFSMLIGSSSTYYSMGGIYSEMSGGADGQRPNWIIGNKDLDTDAYEKAIGYRLKQVIGDTQSAGYATIGLLESSLDEEGYPQYKDCTLTYARNLLRDTIMNGPSHDQDGWLFYTAVRGARNGEIFGYAPGGQWDMDPNTDGVQGVPMDFATAIARHWGLQRRGGDLVSLGKNRKTIPDGDYDNTMAKKEYLRGSWLDCKKYISTWYDLAYYMLSNFWVPNSYNRLQNEYNYLNLYKSTKGDTAGHYVFDSKLTTTASSPYTSAVTYDKNAKTIGLAGATYHAYFGSYEAYNPFTPVRYGHGNKAESTNPYYMDDGVNNLSNYGGNLFYTDKNYGYSMVCNGEFTFDSNLMFHFDGDDDVYLFINGELVMDLGATHNNTASTIYLDNYVTWAETVLKNRGSYSLDTVARAEKLNLQKGEVYDFDFFYMERHGTGANLRIETNINVVVPELEVEKVASQNGNEVPDNGVVNNAMPVEYGFRLTNDGDTSKLYNLTFTDDTIGVKLDYTNGLTVTGQRITDKDGGTLDATDLVAYVDGYNGDPARYNTKKLDTITVTFADNTALKNFLKNLTADGTQSGYSTGIYEGDGLWAHATVTIRGVYYTQSEQEQGNPSFTNKVYVTAGNGDYTLSGEDPHTVYKFGEPSYFQWAGHEIIIDSEKLVEDLMNSEAYKDKLPAPGNMEMTLTDGAGVPMKYDHVTCIPGGDAYISVNYPDAGYHTFSLKIEDKTGKKDTIVISVVVYTVDAKASNVVLDYGLEADLTDHGILLQDGDWNLGTMEVLNTVLGVAATEESADADYVYHKYHDDPDNDQLPDLSLEAELKKPNTENGITAISGIASKGNFSQFRGKLDNAVFLEHNKPWVMEIKTSGHIDNVLLFSMEEVSNTYGNRYLFIRNSASQDIISFGYNVGGNYQNCGIVSTTDNVKFDLESAETYTLVNKVNTDGTNMVWLYVNGVKQGPLNQSCPGGSFNGQLTDWISGKDFNFNYVGTPGYCLNGGFESVKVWEEGLPLENHRWELIDGAMTPVETGKVGSYQIPTNAPVVNASNKKDPDGYYQMLNERVVLNHDVEWAIEFKYEGLNLTDATEAMIMSSIGTGDGIGHEYLYMRADIGLVSMGRHDAAGYHNYGYAIKQLYDENFDTNEPHVYRLENRLEADDTNVVYLIVDGVELGAMGHYYEVNAYKGDGNFFNGNDFAFLSIGNGFEHWPIDGTLHYLQIDENPALGANYGWGWKEGCFVDLTETDTNSNRIRFTPDTDGKLEGTQGYFRLEGSDLSFHPTAFMDQVHTVEVAMAVHDRTAVPTPLAEQYVDISSEVQLWKTINVIPANVVYYEDSFPSLHYVSGAFNSFTTINGGTDLTQNADQNTNYGSDNAYGSSIDDISGNSIHKIKIGKDAVYEEDGKIKNRALAYFTFKGTGFELISRASAAEYASVFLQVYTGSVTVEQGTGKVSGGTKAGVVPVITQFDNQNNLGAEEVYQVPIARWESGKAATEYTVVVYGVPRNVYDENGDSTGVEDTWLYIDGLRIYQPLGASHGNYRDVESNAKFTELRDEIIAGKFAASTVSQDGVTVGTGLTVFSENLNGDFVGSTVQYVTDYLLTGPNNEVYLDGTFTRSALLMQVKEDSTAVHDLQIAAHAMDFGKYLGTGCTGLGAVLKYCVLNGGVYEWKTLTTLTGLAEQYYTVPYTECPLVDGYYQVALRIEPLEETIPALAAFTGVKTNGLTFGSYKQASGTQSGNLWLDIARKMTVSNAVWTGNESAPGESFETGTASIQPKYPSLSFEEEIKYNIYFTVEDLGSFTTADLGLAIFDTENHDGTVRDAAELISGAVFQGDCYVLQTGGIPAKNLGDRLYFKVWAKLADGSYVYSDLYSYSALDYARHQLMSAGDPELKQLMVAMLNYGAAAQRYFGYRTDALLNAELLDGDLSLADGYRADMVKELSAVDASKAGGFGQNVGGFSRRYPSITFGGAFSINYFFTPANEADRVTFYYWTQEAFDGAAVLTADNATGKLDMIPRADGSYEASVDGIAAKNLSDTVFVAAVYELDGVTYSTGVLTYSLGAYCAQMAQTQSDELQTFASATAVYGYYAENYFNN